MIDTHCHLDSPRFDGDRAEVLARAWSAGLQAIVVPAIGPASWEAVLELPRSEGRLKVALGIHPQLLPELPPEQDEAHLSRLDALLASGRASAVGECGLDGASSAGAPLERQVSVLKAHFSLARKHRLPVLVHCLRAHPALLKLLDEEPVPERGMVLHSYSGSAELVRHYSRLGCYFSFAGPVTYEGSRKPIEAARAVTPERLLVETDSPDQAPHPHRGDRCEPGHLPLIVASLAAACGVAVEEVARRTSQNASRLFGFDAPP